MKIWLAALVALGISLPDAALAGAGSAAFVWAPLYTGKFGDYFPPPQTDLENVSAKNGRVAKRCPAVGKLRGARLKVKKVAEGQTSTSGFFSAFADGDQVRPPATFSFVIDVEKLKNENARAAIELDTPFVPVGGPVTNFLAFVVNRRADGDLDVFLAADGGNVGTPIVLPGETPGVVGQLVFANDVVDASAASCTSTTPAVSVGDDVPFVFDTSFGIGAGITGIKGDEAGIHLAIGGDLYGDEAKRTVLGDLQAVIDLEFAAAQDLANSMPTEAKAKLDQARALILDQGPEAVPPTKPPTFRPPLDDAVTALPASDARDEALKRLQKAAGRDQKASDALAATPPKVEKALKEIEKANTEKQRAKGVLETGVAAEAKF